MISKKRNFALVALLTLSFLLPPTAFSADSAAQVETVSLGSSNLPVVVGIKGLPLVANPFDPSQARVVATINRPDGTTIDVEGFWYQEYMQLQVCWVKRM